MIEIIPSIDIIDGKCVRLNQGSFDAETRYRADPVSLARKYQDLGFRKLHLVDLDGARKGHVVNIQVLHAVCSQTDLVVDFGGGIMTTDDLRRVIGSGAQKVNLGSLAVRNRGRVIEWLDNYDRDLFILSADSRKGKIAYDAWQSDSRLDLFEFIDSYIKAGISCICTTEISRDGLLQGPDLQLYRQLAERFRGACLIASGGISEVSQVHKLEDTGMDAAIIGKALYEKEGFPELLAQTFNS